MEKRKAASAAFAAGCALALAIPAAQAQVPTETVTNAPQWTPGDSSRSAARNNAESRQYMRLLQTDWGFRQARIRKECSPIADLQLRENCVASFDMDTPFVGSTRLAGNEWYPPNPPNYSQSMTLAPGMMTGSSGYMDGTGTPGYGAGTPGVGAWYGAGDDTTVQRSQTLRPIPGQSGPEPWYSSRNYPGQGTSVPPAGAMPTYPGPRTGGPMSGGGGGDAGAGGGAGGPGGM